MSDSIQLFKPLKQEGTNTRKITLEKTKEEYRILLATSP